MATISNPNFNPALPESATNQRFIFDTPTMINQQTGQMTSITGDSLAPVTPINLPNVPADTTDYAAKIKGINDMNAAMFKAPATTEPDWISKYFKEPESLVSTYQTEAEKAGIETKQTAVSEAQKQLDLLNAELAGLTAEAQGVPIQIQKEYEGRGATAAGVRPIETARLRDIALRALPMQAQILSQQAILTGNQNTLKLAQDKLDTLFTLKTKDADRQYQYNKDKYDAIREYLTDLEKTKLAKLEKEDTRKYEEQKDRLSLINDWSKIAINSGQSDLIRDFSALDVNDPNFEKKFGEIKAKVEKAKVVGGADITEFKAFFPNVDITTPQGQQQFLNWKARMAVAGRTPEVGVPIAPEDKRILIGAGFVSKEIDQIENDISTYGINKVLEGITDEKQKNAINKVYGGKEVELTRENVAKLYGLTDDETKTGWFGFGKTNKEKLNVIMDSIQKYRDIGYKDADILKLIK